MDYFAVVGIEVLSAIASLILISIGLAIIFGMMRVINLAHGEFLMLGGYAAITATKAGVIVERCVVRFLYGRMIDTMLATWGLSLLLIGLVTTIFGNVTAGISSPLGSFSVGSYKVSLYTLFLILVATVVSLGIYLLLKRTRFGLVARGTMQNANMAAALGLSPPRIYSITFGIGAALAGLAGGVLAPITGVDPVRFGPVRHDQPAGQLRIDAGHR